MEVAAAASSTPTSAGLAGQMAALRGGPFQREVREWQHVDPNTGALLTGRLEADRWVNGPLNSYGKVGFSFGVLKNLILVETMPHYVGHGF